MNYLSLFSGIEAASVAWKPLGWTCVGVAEIDPFPCAVLAHHYPAVPNLGSVTDITDEQIAALGPIDVVVGGSPCQDLSVAGKRVGLAGERSGLFHHQLRIFHAARHLCGARFIVWENVPGAFSTHGGRDFAVVVGAMAGCELPVPADGWGTEGVALGEHGLVEWAVLDAQWFGVAQRRRRVFAVLDVGDWSARPPILLEPDRLRGDSAPSREAGEGSTAGVIKGAAIGRQPHNGPQYGDAIADGSCYTLTTNEVHAVAHSLRGDSPPSREAGKDVAPTIAARTRGGGGLGTDFDCDGGLVVGVAHSLRAEGFDASEDGTGRGTPIVPVAFDTTQITSAANYSRPKAGDPCHPLAAGAHAPAIAFMADDYKDGGYEECDTARPLTTSADRTRAAPVIAFSGKDYGADAGEVAPTLRGMGHDASHANGGGQVAVAFESRFARNGRGAPSDVVPPLKAQSGETGKGDGAPLLATAMQVRRLTPVECCRLQGFPEVEKAVTIFVCSSDLQKNSALAEIRNHRSQERAYSVAANQSLPSARPAGRDSSICLLGHDWPVALHVQIDCVQRQVRISSRGRLLWSASSAAQANSSRLPMPVEDFVRLAAHTMGCLVPTMQSGRVDATEGSTSRVSGHEFAVLSASEIAGNASDAERLKSATSAFMTSITSPVQRNSPSYEQTLQTWSCFVAAAIASYIPEQIRSGSSFALSVEAITDYLDIPYRGRPAADGNKYKALGNSMAVPVMRWIGQQIAAAASLRIAA